MIAIVLALCSATVLGVSDFIAGVAGRQVAAIRVVLTSYTVSFVILLGLAALVGGSLGPLGAGWGLALGVTEGLAMWWFYQALATGPIAVVSLITAALASGIPVVAGIALGEWPGVWAGAGVAVGLAAVVLLGVGERDTARAGVRFDRKVAVLTVCAGTAFSGVSICLHHMPAAAGLWPAALARVPALVIFVLVAHATSELRILRGSPLRVAFLLGILNVISMVAAWRAYQTSLLPLVSVLVSLYPVTTMLLAFTVLRERVSRWQQAGLLLAVAAVALIASH